MATNGHATSTVEEVKQQAFDYELLAEDPVTPAKSWKFTRKREREYFNSIDWPAWWNEFNTAGVKGSGWKYGSLLSFVQSKTKIHWQQLMLKRALGPKPAVEEEDGKVKITTPYLGDWTRRRKNGFYVFDDPVKAQAVQEALEQRKELRAATMALAPMIARRIAFWYKIRDQIVEAYAGRVISRDKTVSSQKERAGRFLRWQITIEETIRTLEEQWMRVHGVNPMDPAQQWVEAAAVGGRIGAAAALTGQVAGRASFLQDGIEMPLPDGITYDSLLLAQHLRTHAETFNLPLPEDQQPKKKSVKAQ